MCHQLINYYYYDRRDIIWTRSVCIAVRRWILSPRRRREGSRSSHLDDSAQGGSGVLHQLLHVKIHLFGDQIFHARSKELYTQPFLLAPCSVLYICVYVYTIFFYRSLIPRVSAEWRHIVACVNARWIFK